MVSQIYMIFFVISLAILAYLVLSYGNKISVYYPLLFGSVSICLLGFMQSSAAKDVDAAVVSTQIAYLGTCFAPFFTMMCVSDLCKVYVKKCIRIVIAAYAFINFLLVFSIGKSDLYYKNITLVQKNGLSVLQKEYGSFHIMYPVFVVLMLLVSLYMITYSLIKKRDVSYITGIMLFADMFAVVFAYIFERVASIEFEILPFAYFIGQLIILFLLKRISYYDIGAVSADSMAESKLNGFLIIDSKGRYYGADEVAKEWFDEIRELSIDHKIATEETDFLRQIGLWIRDEAEKTVEYFERGGRIIEARHTIFKKRGRGKIHCIYLRDDTRQQEYTRLVEQYNENLERDVDAKTEKIREIQNDIITSMASIVENRDNNTGGHIQRTSDIVRIFVKHLREIEQYNFLDATLANNIIKAAPLHDFGKIAIPDVILNKPGKFTEDEYEIMKLHPGKGAVIVERILMNSEDEQFREVAVNVAHYHHERWDGNGYPEKIGNDKIPFEARVMALADVFDALVSKRVYKESFSFDRAFDIIAQAGGEQFDPDLCQEFLQCRSMLEDLYNSYDD